MKRLSVVIIALAALVASTACNEASSGGETPTAPVPPPAPPPPPSAPPSAAPNAAPSAAPSAATQEKVEIEIAAVGNTMTFDKTKLTVPAGALVHLKLKNPATMATLPHNWVLVVAGTQAKVAAEGLAKAPDAGYIVEGPNVLAYTPLAPPGGNSEVTFTAPAAGNYPYICSVPGHYMQMKGVLTVTP
jgi:azurin